MKEISVKVVLDKGTKTVKGTVYECKELNRTVAIHADVVSKNKTTLTDLATGYKFLTLNTPVDKIKEQEIKENLDKFLKHFGIKETLEKLEYLAQAGKEVI